MIILPCIETDNVPTMCDWCASFLPLSECVSAGKLDLCQECYQSQYLDDDDDDSTLVPEYDFSMGYRQIVGYGHR